MAKKSLQLLDKRTIAQPDRRFWGVQSSYGSYNFFLYSIGLYDLQTNQSINIPGADPARDYNGRGTPHFQFPTPPKMYEIVEPASTTIVPTQDGGKFVESQGSIFKDIRIGGTVGLRPHPRANTNLLPAGFTKATGISLDRPSLLQSKDERGLDPAEITGQDDIIFLRNIFRAYWDLKRSNIWANRVVMIWIAAKESEWYIVEPISFTSNRDSANPMSWAYQIALRTLYRFDAKFKLPDPDPVIGFGELTNAWNKFKTFTRDTVRGVQQLTSATEWLLALPFDVVSLVLSESAALLAAGASVRNAGKRLGDIYGKDRLIALAKSAESLGGFATENAATKSGGDVAPWSVTTTVAAGLRPDSNYGIPDVDEDAALDIHANPIVRGSRQIQRAAEGILALDGFFSGPKQVMVDDRSRAYQDAESGEAPYTAGSPLDLNNIVVPSTGEEALVQKGDTIRSFAKRELGNEALWKTVAVLNGLVAPYISPSGSSRVAAYGDSLLIPRRFEEDDFLSVREGINTDAAMEAQTKVVKGYGRDLRLDTNFETISTDLDSSDLKVDQRGDLDVIDGVDNVKQAYLIKFSTEQGELALHPDFGAAYPIGTKINLNRMQEFAVNTRRTLLQDNRTDTILRMSTFTVGGDQIQVGAAVKLVKSNLEIPVSFVVRVS